MTEALETLGNSEIGKLSHDFTYYRYLMNRGQMREAFRKISIPEYIALHRIAVNQKEGINSDGRTYLKDLAEKMQLNIHQTSRMIRKLQEQGLVYWSHDGNGSEGTYVIITETGQKLLEEQEVVLKKYYGRVIGKFGKENLIQLLQLMRDLEQVMRSEIEVAEEEPYAESGE